MKLQWFSCLPLLNKKKFVFQSEDIFNLRLQRELQNQWRLLEQKQSQQNAMEEMKMDNAKLKQSLQKQQEQIHQLTQSLNQCFQALLIMQRDMAEQKSQQQQPQCEDTMDSVSQQRDFESCPSASWDFDFAPNSRVQGPAAQGLETWNNFFPPHVQDPRLLGGESESGVSTNTGSGALNNTVPPGMRANNYWDNFRSFSRQNRLSSNLQSLSPIVAQVTPRQVQPQLHLPHSPFRSNNNGDHHQSLLDNAAIIAPLSFSSISSPSRPRRKQKINREQNVSNESRPQPEAAMVFPIRQERQVQPNNPRRQQNEVQPMMLNNPVVTSIKRSIYSHVNELIAQNEERPERLARIFQDLQTINRSDQALESANADALANLNVSSSTSGHLQRPSWSMYSAADVEDEDNGVTSTTFKNSGIKRFTPNDNRLAYLASSSAMHPNAENNSSNSSLVAEDDRLLPTLFSFEESLSSLGAVGGSGEQTEKNKKVNESQNVAVPKNVQRNIISRERDGRKVKREKQPRNMQQNDLLHGQELDHHAGAESLSLTFRNNEENDESEMIEADQQDNQSFMDLQPLEVGLDRVPTRLSSTELDHRRAEEEDNIQNLVDEVLNSSSDTDFVANDHNLPSPKS